MFKNNKEYQINKTCRRKTNKIQQLTIQRPLLRRIKQLESGKEVNQYQETHPHISKALHLNKTQNPFNKFEPKCDNLTLTYHIQII